MNLIASSTNLLMRAAKLVDYVPRFVFVEAFAPASEQGIWAKIDVETHAVVQSSSSIGIPSTGSACFIAPWW